MLGRVSKNLDHVEIEQFKLDLNAPVHEKKKQSQAERNRLAQEEMEIFWGAKGALGA